MKAILFSICILFSGASIGAAQQPKTGCGPEFIIENPDPQSGHGPDWGNILIKVDGEIVAKFKAAQPDFARVIAKWNGYDANYVLLRTSEGQGSCAGGYLYAIAFLLDEQGNTTKGIKVSPALHECIGEFPPVAFSFAGPNADLVIEVSGYVLRGFAARWTPKSRWVLPPRGKR